MTISNVSSSAPNYADGRDSNRWKDRGTNTPAGPTQNYAATDGKGYDKGFEKDFAKDKASPAAPIQQEPVAAAPIQQQGPAPAAPIQQQGPSPAAPTQQQQVPAAPAQQTGL